MAPRCRPPAPENPVGILYGADRRRALQPLSLAAADRRLSRADQPVVAGPRSTRTAVYFPPQVLAGASRETFCSLQHIPAAARCPKLPRFADLPASALGHSEIAPAPLEPRHGLRPCGSSLLRPLRTQRSSSAHRPPRVMRHPIRRVGVPLLADLGRHTAWPIIPLGRTDSTHGICTLRSFDPVAAAANRLPFRQPASSFGRVTLGRGFLFEGAPNGKIDQKQTRLRRSIVSRLRLPGTDCRTSHARRPFRRRAYCCPGLLLLQVFGAPKFASTAGSSTAALTSCRRSLHCGPAIRSWAWAPRIAEADPWNPSSASWPALQRFSCGRCLGRSRAKDCLIAGPAPCRRFCAF